MSSDVKTLPDIHNSSVYIHLSSLQWGDRVAPSGRSRGCVAASRSEDQEQWARVYNAARECTEGRNPKIPLDLLGRPGEAYLGEAVARIVPLPAAEAAHESFPMWEMLDRSDGEMDFRIDDADPYGLDVLVDGTLFMGRNDSLPSLGWTLIRETFRRAFAFKMIAELAALSDEGFWGLVGWLYAADFRPVEDKELVVEPARGSALQDISSGIVPEIIAETGLNEGRMRALVESLWEEGDNDESTNKAGDGRWRDLTWSVDEQSAFALLLRRVPGIGGAPDKDRTCPVRIGFRPRTIEDQPTEEDKAWLAERDGTQGGEMSEMTQVWRMG